MLQTMRSSAKYIWLFIVAAFVVGFLLYQTSGLFGRAPITSTTSVATVNGEDILVTTWQRLSQQLEEQQTQGSGRSVSLDERRRIQEQAFNQLVDEVLLRQELQRRGITVTDDELADAAKYTPPQQLMQDPELQTGGQFDIAKYQRLLNSPIAKQNGLLFQLEQYYRDQIPKQKLYEQIAAGVYPSDGQLWQNFRDTHDTAQITYAVLRPTAPDTSIHVSDDEVRAYYDAHKQGFDHPGRAAVAVAIIPRVISAADSAAVRNHALALRARILKGDKFEDVAKSESADSGSAVNGGDLGKGGRGRFVAPFEAAAYALKPGDVSEPVLTQFGYHLIRMDSRSGDTIALHHILLRIAQSDSEADHTDRKADSLSKMAANAESPARFEAAVKALHLETVRAFVTEGQPLVSNGRLVPSVSSWAFGGAKPGEASDLFDDDNGYYLARLEAVTPGGIPSLDVMKNDIRELLVRRKQIHALTGAAQKLAIAAAASSLEQATTVLHTPVSHSTPFTRVSTVPGVGNANEVIGAAFSLPVGAVSAPIETDDGVYVIRVDRRVPVDRRVFEVQQAMMRQQRLQSLEQARVRQFLTDLRNSAKIKDNRKAVEAAERRSNDA
jgi:peptidyl-prolyl cis-trans isomerase D